MKKILLLIIIITGFYLGGSSQCFNKITSFKAGEEISFEVYYNWGFIWLNAAEAAFKVSTGTYKGKEMLHFNSFGKTLKGYDWIYKVDDTYEVYAEDNILKPHKFIRKTSQGSFRMNNSYHFDYDNQRIFSFTQTSERPYSEDTLNLPECTFDMLSAIYYARCIDYSKFKINDKIPIAIVIDGELSEIYIRYLGKDTLETRSGAKYKCILFSALMIEGSIFTGGEALKVWVTDDNNKIPVLIEAKILVGTVKAYLSDTKGLRHKMEAKIESTEGE